MKNKFLLTVLTTIGIFYSFFLFGYIDAIKGPIMPSLMSDMKLTYNQAGSLISFIFTGFLIATLLSGITADKFGKRPTLIFTASLIFTGGILIVLSENIIFSSIAFFVIGYGLGSLELMGNAVIIDLYKKDRAKMLNYLTFFYSVGAVISPVIAGFILKKGFIWKNVYQITVIISVIFLIYFIFLKYPNTHTAQTDPAKKFNLKNSFNIKLIFIYIIMTSYMAAEVGLITWLVDYLIKIKSIDIVLSSVYLSVFFICLGLGRVIGSFFVEKIGYIKLMIICTILSVISLFTGLFLNLNFAFFFSLTGLFFSIMFPTVTAFFSKVNTDESNTKYGILFTFSGLGGLIGPLSVGALGEIITIKNSLFLIPFFCILIFIFLLILLRSEKKLNTK